MAEACLRCYSYRPYRLARLDVLFGPQHRFLSVTCSWILTTSRSRPCDTWITKIWLPTSTNFSQASRTGTLPLLRARSLLGIQSLSHSTLTIRVWILAPQQINWPKVFSQDLKRTAKTTPSLRDVSEARGGFSMGDHTLLVSNELFADNRRRLCQRLNNNAKVQKNSFVLLQGGDSVSLYDTDVEYNNFRQEPYFHWTFGVKEPGCYGVLEASTAKALLFVPKLPEEYGVWMGQLLTKDDFKEMYDVDEVHYVCDIASVLKNCKPATLLTLNGVNTDSNLTVREAAFDGISEFNVNNELLHHEIAECRMIKSDLELEVLRYVNKVSSDAHIQIMRTIHSGMMEYQAEATFLNYVYLVGGCRHVSYTCICGSGDNGSVLHYGHAAAPNDKKINDGEMCLFDMGASYNGYSSDITCTFPVNGKFTKDQAIIYNAVLKANLAVMGAAKPGVSWVDMHKLANRVMLGGLRDAGLLKGDVDEMMKVGLGAVFQPHGLGHLMGLDVHDVGGYLKGAPTRPKEVGVNRLRTARVLEKGMVITIEPGCYFIDMLLDRALANPEQSKFMVADMIKLFRNFGGVRIEDDVIITADGVENMTKVPRTVKEIETVMAKKLVMVPPAPTGKLHN